MKLIKFCLFFSLIFFSCKKDKLNTDINQENIKHTILVLNEGLFQLNNSSVTSIQLDSNHINDHFFEDRIGRKLGDTGNDIQVYGNKIYIVMNVSSSIEVLDKTTGKSLKQLLMNENNSSKQPRYIDFYGENAFVTCFDGFVDVIDTHLLYVKKRIPVGLNPDHLLVHNEKLYVSNSGGLNTPTMDSTISIINLTTFEEETRLNVGVNPGKLVGIGNDIFVHQRGNYSNIPSRLKKINTLTNQLIFTSTFSPSVITSFHDKLLVYQSNNPTYIGLFDGNQWSIENFINVSNITTLYGIQYEQNLNSIFLFDANGYTNTGKIFSYSESGTYLSSYEVGLNPTALVYFK